MPSTTNQRQEEGCQIFDELKEEENSCRDECQMEHSVLSITFLLTSTMGTRCSIDTLSLYEC